MTEHATDLFPLARLRDLSENLWWTWVPDARRLFSDLDPMLWRRTRFNPVALLHAMRPERLHEAARDPDILERLNRLAYYYDAEMAAPPDESALSAGITPQHPLAYFCAEFGLHTSVPIYSGGLGILAGDHCRAASDARLPMVGVGLLYQRGYFRQRIEATGRQQVVPEEFHSDLAPLHPLRGPDDREWLTELHINGRSVRIAVWRVEVGRVPIYLLDTDLPGNDPEDRTLTSHLYGGDGRLRLRQEAILGIGGVRALRAMGIAPSVWHLNEGHTALLIAERIAEKTREGSSWDVALEEVRQRTVFTTHTPVAAGHDHFERDLVWEVLGRWLESTGGIAESLLQTATHPEDPAGDLNMTVLAMRGSRSRNGVSRRHGEVARRMWRPLWPDLPESDVPIGHVTNGVHVPFWMSPELRGILEPAGATDDARRAESLAGALDAISDDAIWNVHRWRKRRLLALIRERIRRGWQEGETAAAQIVAAGALLDPGTLTLGFARRFASYKRATLLFRDPERLKRLLNDPWQPVQIVFAGKAHPRDETGLGILQQVYARALDPSLSGRIAFVEDYDMQLGSHLVSGVDVWLNNPRPPMEASGTSGVKASLNGVPHLSTLDGWWLEAYDGSNGWAIGPPPQEGTGDPPDEQDDERDPRDAENLYRILEEAVIPRFYDRDAEGIPRAWIAIMRRAILTAGSQFSARRMLEEYLSHHYTPAASGGGEG